MHNKQTALHHQDLLTRRGFNLPASDAAVVEAETGDTTTNGEPEKDKPVEKTEKAASKAAKSK